MLTAIAKNGCALFHTSEELKADREVALASVAKYDWALKYLYCKTDDSDEGMAKKSWRPIL